MIDLHTHTTASDGRYSPAGLVARASAAGVTVLAVTDHDTVASCAPAALASADAGIAFVPGIEITAVRGGADNHDIHILGYFIDLQSPALARLLADGRRQRLERARQMIAQLARLGVVLDAGPILQPALDNESASIGRPWIARALVAAGYEPTTNHAFDRWLSPGRPGFVPRVGPTPEAVIERIHDAGGVASLAHPALRARRNDDGWIEDLARAGLDAVEAYHSKHDAQATAHYLALAARLDLAVSGGSDFHGNEPGDSVNENPSHGPGAPGAVTLPQAAYEGLSARRPTMRASASGAATSS